MEEDEAEEVVVEDVEEVEGVMADAVVVEAEADEVVATVITTSSICNYFLLSTYL